MSVYLRFCFIFYFSCFCFLFHPFLFFILSHLLFFPFTLSFFTMYITLLCSLCYIPQLVHCLNSVFQIEYYPQIKLIDKILRFLFSPSQSPVLSFLWTTSVICVCVFMCVCVCVNMCICPIIFVIIWVMVFLPSIWAIFYFISYFAFCLDEFASTPFNPINNLCILDPLSKDWTWTIEVGALSSRFQTARELLAPGVLITENFH